jgi:hypothetical protein
MYCACVPLSARCTYLHTYLFNMDTMGRAGCLAKPPLPIQCPFAARPEGVHHACIASVH